MDAVSQVRLRVVALRRRERGDHGFLGLIPTGVNVHRPSEIVHPANQLLESFWFNDPCAPIFGLVEIGFEHAGSAVAHATVDHELDAR